MPDILSEQVLTLSQAARYLNGRLQGANYGPSAVFRWIRHGRMADDGSRVHLGHARLGRRLLTSVEAVSRFSARLAQNASASSENTPTAALDDLKAEGFFGGKEDEQ